MWLGASAYHGHAPACGLDQSSLPGSFNPSLISAISTRQNSGWQNPGAENRQIKESPEREPVGQYLECHFVIVTTVGLEILMSSNGKIGTLVVFDNMSTYNLLSSKGRPHQGGFVEIYGPPMDHMDHNPKISSRTVLRADPLISFPYCSHFKKFLV